MSFYAAFVIVAHVALGGVGVWLLVIDARAHRLPDRIVLPTLVGALVLVALDALFTQDATRFLRASAGMLTFGGFFVLLRLISRGGMGGGDVKLAAVLGVVLGWHGWTALAVAAASAFGLASVYALALIVLRRATGKTRIAFGPWMIVGAVLAIVVS